MTVVSTNNDEQNKYHLFRISDITNEPLVTLPSLTGYETMPLVSLEEAVQPLISILPTIGNYVELAKQRCKNPPADGLTFDQSASIMLYSIGWKPADQCLHIVLNAALRSRDRQILHPWLSYLKLFLTALSSLPSIDQNIYRGIQMNLSEIYRTGQTVTWSTFSSCTNLIHILQSEEFFNLTVDRTLFTIESFSAKDIRRHSYYQFEEEFLLLPGTQFKVQGNSSQNNGMHSIRLQEILIDSSVDQVPLTDDGICVGFDQLRYPSAVCVDLDDQTLYIADSGNHRIVEWKNGERESRIVAGGHGQGQRLDQLNWPIDVILDKQTNSLIISDKDNRRVVRWSRENPLEGEILISNIDCYGLAMDDNGDLYISDKEKHEVRRWKINHSNGVLIAGGNGQGNRLDQLNGPLFIYVDKDQSLYISDCWNHRVMKWMRNAREGRIVAGSRTRGNTRKQLSNPQGILVDPRGMIYIADCGNSRLICWPCNATEGSIVAGGNAYGEVPTQFQHPFGLAFDQQRHLYIADQGNHCIRKYLVD